MADEPILLGVPVGCGGARPGCEGGPGALRAAGVAAAIGARTDLGDVPRPAARVVRHPNPAIRGLGEAAAWIEAVGDAALGACRGGRPVFLGGDHLMSAGTVTGVARHAAERGRPLFVLWIDAHPDFHDLASTRTGNLHGTSLAYATGAAGFAPHLPPPAAPVVAERVSVVAARSVDPAERAAVARRGVEVKGVADASGAVSRLLGRVADAGGLLHVSLDADALDPREAPGVGTPVPGGLSMAQARGIAATLGESGLVTSLDLAEVNPALDPGGRTARAMVELAAAALGRHAARRKAA